MGKPGINAQGIGYVDSDCWVNYLTPEMVTSARKKLAEQDRANRARIDAMFEGRSLARPGVVERRGNGGFHFNGCTKIFRSKKEMSAAWERVEQILYDGCRAIAIAEEASLRRRRRMFDAVLD
ncbi:MAG: hypothetical protein WBQ89_01190 [Candidatus Acidiferrum sp.]